MMLQHELVHQRTCTVTGGTSDITLYNFGTGGYTSACIGESDEQHIILMEYNNIMNEAISYQNGVMFLFMATIFALIIIVEYERICES